MSQELLVHIIYLINMSSQLECMCAQAKHNPPPLLPLSHQHTQIESTGVRYDSCFGSVRNLWSSFSRGMWSESLDLQSPTESERVMMAPWWCQVSSRKRSVLLGDLLLELPYPFCPGNFHHKPPSLTKHKLNVTDTETGHGFTFQQ